MDYELCIRLLKEEIETKGQIQLVVHGDSMLPTIKSGDRITVVKTNNYKVNDIIVYYTIIQNKISIIAHRVIFVRQTYILAKGDNNSFIDPLKIPLNNKIKL